MDNKTYLKIPYSYKYLLKLWIDFGRIKKKFRSLKRILASTESDKMIIRA